MKERILNYKNRIDTLIKENSADTDWKSITDEHLVQISFFQHERFVHLIVTVTFAILLCMSMGILLITSYYPLLLLTALFFALLIPYISHYYLLENTVQYMYKQYDILISKCK